MVGFPFQKRGGKERGMFYGFGQQSFHTCFAYLVLLRLMGQYDLIGFLSYIIYEDPERDLLGHGFPDNHVG